MSDTVAVNIADCIPCNGMYLDATMGTYKGDQIIQSAYVYATDNEGGVRMIGLIQLGREDGSEWMISLNKGWLAGEAPGDIYAALDRLGELRAEADAAEAQFRSIMRAINEAPDVVARDARHDLRALVNAIGRNTVSGHGVRHAASELAADDLF